MSRYFLALRDSSPNSNPIYLRFENGHWTKPNPLTENLRDAATSTICLLEKISKVNYDNDPLASQMDVDTNYSGCDMMLVQGDDPISHPRQRAREIWKERIGEGRWTWITEAEAYHGCVPDYVMCQILDGVEIQ